MFSRSLSRLLVVLMLLGCGALAACGQKGPLYLPVEEGEEREERQLPDPPKPGSPGGIYQS